MNFSVKPIFIGWLVLLCQLPIQIFMTVWSGGFFGGMTSALPVFEKGYLLPFALFGGLAFFGVPAICYFGKKFNYMRTEYRFLDDRLEFEEGFFTINKKVIKFSDVKEITLRKGFFQRSYGLGSIYLATLATGSSPRANVFSAFGFGNISASGIGIRDIQDPDAVYEKIKTIVDTNKL